MNEGPAELDDVLRRKGTRGFHVYNESFVQEDALYTSRGLLSRRWKNEIGEVQGVRGNR